MVFLGIYMYVEGGEVWCSVFEDDNFESVVLVVYSLTENGPC